MWKIQSMFLFIYLSIYLVVELLLLYSFVFTLFSMVNKAMRMYICSKLHVMRFNFFFFEIHYIHNHSFKNYVFITRKIGVLNVLLHYFQFAKSLLNLYSNLISYITHLYLLSFKLHPILVNFQDDSVV